MFEKPPMEQGWEDNEAYIIINGVRMTLEEYKKTPEGIKEEEKRQARQQAKQVEDEKKRKKNEERFESEARMRNAAGFPWERMFKKKIAAVDVAHEEALEDNKQFDREKAQADTSTKKREERDRDRREKQEAITKEVDALKISIAELERVSPVDTQAIAQKKMELREKLDEWAFWSRLR